MSMEQCYIQRLKKHFETLNQDRFQVLRIVSWRLFAESKSHRWSDAPRHINYVNKTCISVISVQKNFIFLFENKITVRKSYFIEEVKNLIENGPRERTNLRSQDNG